MYRKITENIMNVEKKYPSEKHLKVVSIHASKYNENAAAVIIESIKDYEYNYVYKLRISTYHFAWKTYIKVTNIEFRRFFEINNYILMVSWYIFTTEIKVERNIHKNPIIFFCTRM